MIAHGQTDNCEQIRIYSSSVQEVSDEYSHLTNLFFLGQILHGVGSAPLWTIGVTYLDDNLPSSTSPLYVGIFYAFAVIGPAIGFLGGGQLLQVVKVMLFRCVQASL